jgi:hypothetical protein
MATIHSQQLARKILPKLTCSPLWAFLLCATVLLSGAFCQDRTASQNKLVPTNFINRQFATEKDGRIEMAVLANLSSQGR